MFVLKPALHPHCFKKAGVEPLDRGMLNGVCLQHFSRFSSTRQMSGPAEHGLRAAGRKRSNATQFSSEYFHRLPSRAAISVQMVLAMFLLRFVL